MIQVLIIKTIILNHLLTLIYKKEGNTQILDSKIVRVLVLTSVISNQPNTFITVEGSI